MNSSMTGSLTGETPQISQLLTPKIICFLGMSAISNKPCLNRELVAKLRSMTETIKMLSTENVALREENDQLGSVRNDRKHQTDQGNVFFTNVYNVFDVLHN